MVDSEIRQRSLSPRQTTTTAKSRNANTPIISSLRWPGKIDGVRRRRLYRHAAVWAITEISDTGDLTVGVENYSWQEIHQLL